MSLDWQIYCQLYREAKDPDWGMFPHPSVGAIAKSLGIARVTVWRRLLKLQRVGFLRGYEVIPNPGLLGVGLRSYNLTIPDPRARLRFLEELEYVDGAFLATIDFGPGANLITISDQPASCLRREKSIRRIDGVETVTPGAQVWLPSCTHAVSKDGWRFIDALRRNPDWSFERLASTLGISAQTVSKRYQLLIRTRAVLGTLVEDFAKFPQVVVGTSLTLADGANGRSVIQAVRRLQPDALEAPSSTRPPGAVPKRPGFLRPVGSVSETERATVALLGIPGIARIDTIFPGSVRAYRHWFDSRIFELLARREA